jgi:uncharacterized protein (TIGR00725 family)
MTFQVTVIGDSTAEGEKYDFCRQLGRMLAEMNAVVITGGRSGVMEAVCRGAYDAGGITVGILPGMFSGDANSYCRVVIPTGMGHGRNILTILPADLVIAVGGKAGTLSEMGFAWIHNKPMIAVKKFGGWAEKMAGKGIDDRRTDPVIEVSSLEEIRQVVGKLIQEKGIRKG